MKDKNINNLVKTFHILSTEEIFKALVIYEMSFTGIQLKKENIETIYQDYMKNKYYTGVIDEELKNKIIEEYS